MRRILRIKSKSALEPKERTPRALNKGSTRKMTSASKSQSKEAPSKTRKGRNTRQKEELVTARKVATRKQTLSWVGGFLWKSLLLSIVTGMLAGGIYYLKKGVVSWGDLKVKSIEINGLAHVRRMDVLAAMDLDIGDAWL